MTTVRFQQYDDTPTETWQCVARGADARGAWFSLDADAALFLPWNADWCAVLRADHPDGIEVEVRTIMPLHVSASLVEAVDLDLGIRVSGAGTELTGEEDFDWNRIALDYPDQIVKRAQEACNEALARLMEGEYPFDRPAGVVVDELRR